MTSSTSDKYPDALRVGTALGEFTITDVIGEGGFGTVYLAYEETLDRTVAIKEYLPVTIAARSGDQTVLVRSEVNRDAYAAGLHSFMREARLQARFSHPAMLEVYRVWEQNGTAYMAMRYYPGESLRDLRRNTSVSITIDEAWIKRILLPVFDAVRELHSQSVLHRDVSPDNILILPSGAPVLLDFGAARMVVAGAAQSLTTVLKPGYAPIEQYAGDGAVEQGPWTDVYGLGAVLYFLAIGNPPPQAVTRMMADTLRGFDDSVAGRYSESFAAAIKSALAVLPENRLQSVTALIEALGWDDAQALPYPQTTNVTTQFANAAALKTVEAQTALRDERAQLIDDGSAASSNHADLSSGALESTVAAPAARVSTIAPGKPVTLASPSPSPALPLPQPMPEGSRDGRRIGAWSLAAILLLGGAYLGVEKFRRAAQTEPVPQTEPTTQTGNKATPVYPVPLPAPREVDANAVGTPQPTPTPTPSSSPPSSRVEQPAASKAPDKSKPPGTAESAKTRGTDGTNASVASPPPLASTPSRPVAATPKSGVATATASPTPKAKPAAGGDVPAARVGCERIFAKLSLGTADLTEVERQKLATCK